MRSSSTAIHYLQQAILSELATLQPGQRITTTQMCKIPAIRNLAKDDHQIQTCVSGMYRKFEYLFRIHTGKSFEYFLDERDLACNKGEQEPEPLNVEYFADEQAIKQVAKHQEEQQEIGIIQDGNALIISAGKLRVRIESK